MDIGTTVAIIIFAITNIAATAIQWGKNSAKLKSIEKAQNEMKDDFEEAIKSMVTYNETTYQRKDMCIQMHREITDSIADIKRLDLSARFSKIETQLSQVQAGIEELKRK